MQHNQKLLNGLSKTWKNKFVFLIFVKILHKPGL